MSVFLVLCCTTLPPQAPEVPQVPPVPQSPPVVEVTPYSQLLARIHAGERVRVASGVPAPAGYMSVEIAGKVGLFECFLQDGKPMMLKIIRPWIQQATPNVQGPTISTYELLLQRIRAGERVLVASSVPAPAGFESIEIPGEVGLFECFLQDGKPMMREIVPTTSRVVLTTNPVVCRT